MGFDYKDYVNSLNGVSTLPDLQELFYSSIQEIGIDSFFYTRLNPKKENWLVLDPPFPVMNHPLEWRMRYAMKGYIKRDPVVQYCITNKQPSNWRRVQENPNIDSDQRMIFNEATDYEIRCGLTIPVFDSSDEMGGLTITPQTQ